MAKIPTGFCFFCEKNVDETKLYCSASCRSKFNRSMKMYAKCWACNGLIKNDGRKVPTCEDAECKIRWYRRNPPPPVPANWEPK